MAKLIYILKEKKILITLIAIILICSIAIAIGVYVQVTNKKVVSSKLEQTEEIYEDLKNNFENIFTNVINKQETAKQDVNYDEIISCIYDIKEKESNKYNIDARVPSFKIENEVTKKINEEIFNTFARKIVEIVKGNKLNITYNLDYVAYVNGNTVSLVISCKYKDGTNPQRHIIKTYNYDMENQKLLTIQDIIEQKNLDKEEVQGKISEEIKKSNNQMKNISEQGYNVFIRNENDEMYNIDKTDNFFLGQDGYLYLIYAYGNNNFTSEKDLVIF